MRNFKQLLIWQKGFRIAVNSIKIVSEFPKEEKYGVSSELLKDIDEEQKMIMSFMSKLKF